MKAIHHRVWAGAVCSFALAAVGCGSSPVDGGDEGTAASQDELVRVYWTGLDENEQPITKFEDVSRARVDAVLRQRDIARERALAGGNVGKVQQSLTVVSTDWESACQYWDWFLLSSAANRGGNLFCGSYSSTSGASAPPLPFLPAYYEASANYVSLLCTANTGCYYFTECGAAGPAVWMAVPAGMSTGNISPPSSVTHMAVNNNGPC